MKVVAVEAKLKFFFINPYKNIYKKEVNNTGGGGGPIPNAGGGG